MMFIDLHAFYIALGKFEMLNPRQLEILTWFFPLSEFLLGLLLIVNIKTKLVSITST